MSQHVSYEGCHGIHLWIMTRQKCHGLDNRISYISVCHYQEILRSLLESIILQDSILVCFLVKREVNVQAEWIIPLALDKKDNLLMIVLEELSQG